MEIKKYKTNKDYVEEARIQDIKLKIFNAAISIRTHNINLSTEECIRCAQEIWDSIHNNNNYSVTSV